MTIAAYRAEILAVPDDPTTGAPIVYYADGLLVVEDGMVAACGPFVELAGPYGGIKVTAFPGQMIVPGFVDAHVHYPQTERIAAHGGQLLDWLD